VKTGRTRLAAYALCVRDDTLLLVRVAPGYPSAGVWTLPGGGVNFGEDPAAGALRELTEESGLTGEIDELAFVDSITDVDLPGLSADPWHGVRIVYIVNVTGGELRDEVEESTDKAEWVPLADVRKRSVSELVDVALTYVVGQMGRS
jgi:8-oxo-dGTP diphosphatase